MNSELELHQFMGQFFLLLLRCYSFANVMMTYKNIYTIHMHSGKSIVCMCERLSICVNVNASWVDDVFGHLFLAPKTYRSFSTHSQFCAIWAHNGRLDDFEAFIYFMMVIKQPPLHLPTYTHIHFPTREQKIKRWALSEKSVLVYIEFYRKVLSCYTLISYAQTCIENGPEWAVGEIEREGNWTSSLNKSPSHKHPKIKRRYNLILSYTVVQSFNTNPFRLHPNDFAHCQIESFENRFSLKPFCVHILSR